MRTKRLLIAGTLALSLASTGCKTTVSKDPEYGIRSSSKTGELLWISAKGTDKACEVRVYSEDSKGKRKQIGELWEVRSMLRNSNAALNMVVDFGCKSGTEIRGVVRGEPI